MILFSPVRLSTENRNATLSVMSAALSEGSERDQLRSIWRTLQRLQTNIQNTQTSLHKADVSQAENHLALAQSNAIEAKKEIAAVGRRNC